MECFVGWLEIPATPSLEVCSFGHGERRRKVRKEITLKAAVFADRRVEIS
jgi:hypothetical protein